MEAKSLFYFGMILILLTGCYKEEIASVDSIILSVNKTAGSITADGVSTSEISVELPFRTEDTMRSVVFSTNKGGLGDELKKTVTVNALDVSLNGVIKKIAKVVLTSSSEEGKALIDIKVQNYLRTDSVLFSRSYPDLIAIEVDKLTYLPNGTEEFPIKVRLKRTSGKGKVSQGQLVSLTVTDSNGLPIGTFRNKQLLCDQDGNCSNNWFLPSSSNYTGTVTITATAKKNATTEIMEQTVINVTK